MNSNALARNINNLTRLFYVISLFVVYFIKVPILYFYIIFFFLNVEILLLKKSQSNTKIFKTTQVFFTLFVSYVLFVRAHMCGFSLTTEDNLNTVEHLLFAFVISLMIYYYCIFFGKVKHSISVVISVVIFNFIGLINEFFQNYFQGKPVFVLDEFSIKDLIVNVLGTLVFILLISLFKMKFTIQENQN